MLTLTKILRSIGLMGACAAFEANVMALDGYLPLEIDSWEEIPINNSTTPESPSSSSTSFSLSDEYYGYNIDPDIIKYYSYIKLDEVERSEEGSENHEVSNESSDQEPSVPHHKSTVETNSPDENTQKYILCHTDLKNIAAKGVLLCHILIGMKQLGVAGNSDLLEQYRRQMLNSDFMTYVNLIPMIFRIYSTEFKIRGEPTLVTLPEGNSIIIPTYKAILDKIQEMHVLTRADACSAQNVIDELIPQTMDIIDNLMLLQNQVWSLIQSTSLKIDLTPQRLQKFHQKTSSILYNSLASESDGSEASSYDPLIASDSQYTSGEGQSDSEEQTQFILEEYGYSDHQILNALLSIGDELNSYLYNMKQDSDRAHSDLSKNDLIEIFIDFQYRIQRISEIFGDEMKETMIGYAEITFTSPWGETIKVPTYKPIVDKIQGLDILDKQDAIRTSRLLEELISQTAGIVFEIAMITLRIQ